MAGVRHYQDLVCWQLSNDLKIKVYALVASTDAKKDFDFRDLAIRARKATAGWIVYLQTTETPGIPRKRKRRH